MMATSSYIESLAQFAEQGLTHFKYGTSEWCQGRLDEIAGALRRASERSQADNLTISDANEEIRRLRNIKQPIETAPKE